MTVQCCACRADSRRYTSHRTTVTSALDDFSSTKVQTSTTRRGYVQHLTSVAAAAAAAAADDDDDDERVHTNYSNVPDYLRCMIIRPYKTTDKKYKPLFAVEVE